MKLFFAVLSVLMVLSGSLRAQKIGEPLTDRQGMEVRYGDNGNLLLRMEDHHFKTIFFDDAGMVVACPFQRVIMRAERHGNNKAEYRFVARSAKGAPFLTHQEFVKPPYAFSVFIALYPGDDDEGKITLPMRRFVWRAEASASE
jgi:hypothetical protein